MKSFELRMSALVLLTLSAVAIFFSGCTTLSQPGAAVPLESPVPRSDMGKCGDGVCDAIESHNHVCSLDCGGESQIQMATPRFPTGNVPFPQNHPQLGNQIQSTVDTASNTLPPVLISSDPDSPFGITTLSSIDKTISFASDLGAKTVRLAGPQAIAWDRIKKQGWPENDKMIGQLYKNGIEISVVVLGGDPAATEELDDYSQFISEMAERYDGDGKADAEGSPVVAYFEIDNEPDLAEPNERSPWKGTLNETKDYALVLQTAYKAIKSANPSAKVAIAGMSSDEKINLRYYEAILGELDKLKDNGDDKFFDVFNFHYYETYEKYMVDGIANINEVLSKYGYSGTPLIVTEVSTYSGQTMFGGINQGLPYQTEAQQAEGMIKRYVYAEAHGVERLYWFMTHADNPLSSTTGSKLLAYYTYKKMAEELGNSDWNNVQVIQEAGGIHIYKFTKGDKPVFVAWNDNNETRDVQIDGLTAASAKITESIPKYETGKEMTDYNAAFNTRIESVQSGKITIGLKDVPVFIEEE